MSAFFVVAACMAAIAAASVAVPLVRDRRSRAVGAAAAICIAGGAAGLYPLWSNWDWHAARTPQTAAPDVAAMVAKLEKHQRDEPSDVAGWLMLGRSYTALERLDDATTAYEQAQRLDGSNAEAALGLGEAMSLRAGGNIPPAAAEQFEQALRLAPDNPKALLYGGFAAAGRGDSAAAIKRWQALKALHPPQQIEQLLDARIAELGGEAMAQSEVAGQGPAAPSSAGQPSADQLGRSAQATLNITITPALQARVSGTTPLFVFAREPGGRGPPLAVKRLTGAAIGTRIQLSAADSMVPGRVLLAGQHVAITARISFSGQPLPVAGDLYGEVTYDVGRDGTRELIIDRVAE